MAKRFHDLTKTNLFHDHWASRAKYPSMRHFSLIFKFPHNIFYILWMNNSIIWVDKVLLLVTWLKKRLILFDSYEIFLQDNLKFTREVVGITGRL